MLSFGTRFPDAGASCGGSANRCLYYGSSCDVSKTHNIVAAELLLGSTPVAGRTEHARTG